MKPPITVKLPNTTACEVPDDDNPAWTEDMLGEPVLQRVRQPQPPRKDVLIAIRVNAEVLDFFKATGHGYQARIKNTLSQAVQPLLKPLPDSETRERSEA